MLGGVPRLAGVAALVPVPALLDLHVGDAQLRERVAQRLGVPLEPVAERLDDRRDAVDRQRRLGQARRLVVTGHQVQHRDLPQPDDVVGHEIDDRRRRQLGADSPQLGRDRGLVEVAPNADPPVCRLMDFKRYEYEQQQRRKESRKKATQVVIKEMKFRPKIDVHDYTTKMRHVERFLAEGNKVKLTIMFRGREMAHPELGLKILERIADEVSGIAMVESAPRQDGRNMTMVLHPLKRPSSGGGAPKDGRRAPSKPPAAPPAEAPEPAVVQASPTEES